MPTPRPLRSTAPPAPSPEGGTRPHDPPVRPQDLVPHLRDLARALRPERRTVPKPRG